MLKLLFGITLGAALMYFFDPREGGERRQALSDRMNRGRDMGLEGAREEARGAFTEARDRARSVASHAKERAGETVHEARDEASTFARNTQERVQSVTGNGQAEGTPNA
jgi:hypothetical protein